MSPRRRRGDLAPCFPVEEKSPRSQPSRFWCNKRVQSRKYAPSVKSTMQLIQIYHALIQIVSLWQLIVTSVTQLHWKGQTVHERYLPGSSTTHLILFYCGWNKAHTPAVAGRHRPTRSSSGTLWPVKISDFLPSCLWKEVDICTVLWLAQMGKMQFVLWRPSSKPNTKATNYYILFTVAKPTKLQRKTAQKGAFVALSKC